MNRKARMISVFLIILSAVFAFAGCGGGSSSDVSADKGTPGTRGSTTEFPVPSASGDEVYQEGAVTVDASGSSHGYVMVKYEGDAEKIKVQLTGPDNNTYTYTSRAGDYQVFPLSAGDGSYRVDVLEMIDGDMYTLAISCSVDVTLADEFEPFLYPNQYVWYTSGMKAMDLGVKLSEESGNDLDFVERVYEYVISNITYDDAKASNVPLDYIPEIDETLSSGKGICFDYASLMAALLRSQGVPTKLVVGYSGSAYHAWISVYTKETGWVDDIIEFDGKNWSLMDPTLASSNDEKAVKKYVGDGSNYTVKYNY